MSTPNTSFQQNTGTPSHHDQARKKKAYGKKKQNDNYSSKSLLSAQTNNPMEKRKSFVGIITKFTKVPGYKVNIQNSIVCLHIMNEKLDTEIK